MKSILFAILVFCSVSVSQAEDYGLAGRWGLGLGGGISSVTGPSLYKDGASELDGTLAASLWARYHVTDRFGLELAVSHLAYEFKTGAVSSSDPTANLVDLSFAYRMWPTKAFHIVLQAGAGYVQVNDLFNTSAQNKIDDFVIKGRMGIEYMMTHDLMLALHGDYYRINLGGGDNSELRILSPTLAVTYYFGGGGSHAPADTDADGVIDSNDKCPGTAAGTHVNAEGCVPVEKTMDADGDGVADTEDKCPGTAAGQAVNEFGCAKTEKLEITMNVRFNPGSSVIDPQFVTDLEKFSEFLKKYPETKAEIEGHTDNTGAEKLNIKISKNRAQAVVDYLVKTYGIEKTRLTAKGYGPAQPIADNTTAEGRAQNRRVVAHVQTEK